MEEKLEAKEEEVKKITIEDIIAHKKLPQDKLLSDLTTLRKYKAEKNERKFCGNPFLYHFQLENLCKVKIKNHPSLYDKMADETLYNQLYQQVLKLNRTGSLANRFFEANRFNNAVCFFKASTAKFLYNKFKATKVLDPTAGWGGRLLGAWSLGIDYTGIDTNINLKSAYDDMIEHLPKNESKLSMIFDDCLKVDFSKIDYDFVLTSPPYVNLEMYECMEPFPSDESFYKDFLIPLIEKCLTHIKEGGTVCINISPSMYEKLLKRGYRSCDEEFDLLQQKRLSKSKQDKIYCWNKN